MADLNPASEAPFEEVSRTVLRVLILLSAGLLAWVLFLHESVVSPVIFGRWSWRFFASVAVVVGSYVGVLFAATGRRWMRGGLRDLMLAGLSTVTVVLSAELVFRAAGGFGLNRSTEFIPYRSHAGKPGAEFVFVGEPTRRNEFRVYHRLNSLGFNDVDHDLRKPEGAYRILILGDSFVEALQVDRTAAFPSLLEEDLRSAGYEVDVIPMARSGWGTLHALEAYRSQGRGFRPDLVLLAFFGANDVRDNFPPLRASPEGATPVYAGVDRLRRRVAGWSDLAYLALDLVVQLVGGFRCSPSCPHEVFDPGMVAGESLWTSAWDSTLDAITTMRMEVELAGADFGIVYVSAEVETAARLGSAYVERVTTDLGWTRDRHAGLDFTLPERRMAEFCLREGVDLLPLTGFLSNGYQVEPDAPRLYFRYDQHWTEHGHRIAADALGAHLRERFLAPPD